jgi:hypothetical protein
MHVGTKKYIRNLVSYGKWPLETRSCGRKGNISAGLGKAVFEDMTLLHPCHRRFFFCKFCLHLRKVHDQPSIYCFKLSCTILLIRMLGIYWKKSFLLVTCIGLTLVTVVLKQTTATLWRCNSVHTAQPCRESSFLYATLSRTVRNRGLRAAFHKSNFSSVHFYTSI